MIDAPIAGLPNPRAFTAVAMPNPHLVTFVDAVDEDELVALGSWCERRPALLPARANVSFVEQRVPSSLFVRTFERGVGLTDSCGSAMAASVLSAALTGRTRFGEPEHGAEIVDRIVGLEPDLSTSAARQFSHAYFMAGRYEDALVMMDRLSTENYSGLTWAMHAAALAAIGRTDAARKWVAKALAAQPGLAIQTMAHAAGFSDAERQRLVRGVRHHGGDGRRDPGLRGRRSHHLQRGSGPGRAVSGGDFCRHCLASDSCIVTHSDAD